MYSLLSLRYNQGIIPRGTILCQKKPHHIIILRFSEVVKVHAIYDADAMAGKVMKMCFVVDPGSYLIFNTP